MVKKFAQGFENEIPKDITPKEDIISDEIEEEWEWDEDDF